MTEEGELEDPRSDGEPFDFCLTSSETAGWLNHYAKEVAYQRAILAPRRPKPKKPINNQCNNCNGQCDANGTCNQCGRNNLRPEDAPCQCHNRNLTFDQWQQLGCAKYRSKGLNIGDTTRKITDRIDNVFERIFYPESETNGITGGPAPGQGSNQRSNQGSNQGFNGQQGFAQPGFSQAGFPQTPTPAAGGSGTRSGGSGTR